MKHTTTILPLIFLALSQVHTAAANEAMELYIFAEEEIEIFDAEGNRSLKRVSADNIIPGDTVVYSTRYQNNGKQPADNVVITNIIPEEVTYLPGSATGSKTITYSVDGGKHFDQAENLRTFENKESRPASHKDYTHIRWLLPRVDSGATGSVSFLSNVNEG